jgi:beta-phosphoglucomutase-like phosphatase (HAD superfamily)
MQPAVIFDMEGVLVDSFAAHRDAWMTMAQTEGIKFGPAQNFRQP